MLIMSEVFKDITMLKAASENADQIFESAENKVSGPFKKLLNAAAFGAVLLATGCASAPTTPDRENNHDRRTKQAAMSYAAGSFAVSALLGGNTKRNVQATLGGALAGTLIAMLDNRYDKQFRQQIEDSGIELFNVAHSHGPAREGIIHIKIPGKHVLGAGSEANLKFMSTLFDAAVWAPQRINQYEANTITGLSLFYTFPDDESMFRTCNVRNMKKAEKEAVRWLNGHHRRLDTGLRINHSEVLRSETGATDNTRLYGRLLDGKDAGATPDGASRQRASCDEGEVTVIATYRQR